jgi:hypothetical protein
MSLPTVKAGAVLLVLVFVFLLGATGAPAAGVHIDASPDWCGSSPNKDWVCRWQDKVYAGPTRETLQLLPQRQPRRILPRTHVATASDGLARLAFHGRGEANCTVGGGSDTPSEVIVRWPPGRRMQQIHGDFSCSSGDSKAPDESFCNSDGSSCRLELRSRGTYLASVAPLPEATASLTESFHRRARIVVCSGFVRVRVVGEGGEGEEFGRSNGRNRFVITIDERTERTEDETVTPESSSSISSSSSSVEINVIGTVPGRGRCASSFVQTQEHFVEP